MILDSMIPGVLITPGIFFARYSFLSLYKAFKSILNVFEAPGNQMIEAI